MNIGVKNLLSLRSSELQRGALSSEEGADRVTAADKTIGEELGLTSEEASEANADDDSDEGARDETGGVEELIALDLRVPESVALHALMLLDEENPESALELLDEGLSVNPDSIRLLFAKAELLLEVDPNPEEALAILEDLRERLIAAREEAAPEDAESEDKDALVAEIDLSLAEARLQDGDLEGAQEAAAEAIRLSDAGDAWDLAGRLYRLSAQDTLAAEAFSRAQARLDDYSPPPALDAATFAEAIAAAIETLPPLLTALCRRSSIVVKALPSSLVAEDEDAIPLAPNLVSLVLSDEIAADKPIYDVTSLEIVLFQTPIELSVMESVENSPESSEALVEAIAAALVSAIALVLENAPADAPEA